MLVNLPGKFNKNTIWYELDVVDYSLLNDFKEGAAILGYYKIQKGEDPQQAFFEHVKKCNSDFKMSDFELKENYGVLELIFKNDNLPLYRATRLKRI